MYIKRHMEQLLEQITGQYPVLLVTGPRQVGKTTMLEHLAQKEGRGRETVTLDDLTVRELAKTDPKMFFQLHKPPLLIDEVQYAPELFPYIKMMVDSPPPAGGLLADRLPALFHDGGRSGVPGRPGGAVTALPAVLWGDHGG